MNKTTGLILAAMAVYLFMPNTLSVKLRKEHVLIVGGSVAILPSNS